MRHSVSSFKTTFLFKFKNNCQTVITIIWSKPDTPVADEIKLMVNGIHCISFCESVLDALCTFGLFGE